MTKILIRIAKLVGDDVWENPEAVGAGREVFWPRALKLRSERIKDGKPVPMCIDHIKTRNVGLVHALSEVHDVDGRWVIAHCDVEEPIAWMRPGTPASMSYCNLGLRVPMPGGWTRHIAAMVTEVSLLSPGKEPYEPGAKVWHIFTEPRAEAAPPRATPAHSTPTRPDSPCLSGSGLGRPRGVV